MASDGRPEPEPPRWERVTEPRVIYRFLQESVPTAEDFRTDGERGKTVTNSEHRDLLTGMSVFDSLVAARERWAQVKDDALKKQREKETEKASSKKRVRPRPFRMSIGMFIGAVVVGPGIDVEIVDIGDPGGHLTMRAPKDDLAARVVDVYPADSKPT
jgi:hypothetical protein